MSLFSSLSDWVTRVYPISNELISGQKSKSKVIRELLRRPAGRPTHPSEKVST